MNTFDEILAAYTKQVNLPWVSDTPPAGRVWIVWFDKSMQRRFSGRIGEFEHATQKAGHGWKLLDLAPWFGNWIAKHELFEGLVEQPNEIRGLLPDIEDALVEEIGMALTECSANDVLAVDGCGALFGVARVSTLISRVASAVPGRLLVGFPGKHSAGVYRLLDARDGWNYHAVPIPADPSV
ncbi:hypothetical protein [Roseovarius indicus]|uniref:DUF1788 domain-containing protein n=1 Tax=Roseovarius indicus TaxID=540747 RepID=A0A0T5P2V4_9RHOB|nr:hypothetical protein [Roseovarius indicus]KRS15482.1 hypothetical protein XM52_23990 [Roseovarius indicus]QEW28650.1 hypothetical protein RIdsm_04482 [Roseovarius indicus]SFE65231.1 hypothetical protein SAMN04488031_1154 [Roseovarius indicus]